MRTKIRHSRWKPKWRRRSFYFDTLTGINEVQSFHENRYLNLFRNLNEWTRFITNNVINWILYNFLLFFIEHFLSCSPSFCFITSFFAWQFLDSFDIININMWASCVGVSFNILWYALNLSLDLSLEQSVIFPYVRCHGTTEWALNEINKNALIWVVDGNVVLVRNISI